MVPTGNLSGDACQIEKNSDTSSQKPADVEATDLSDTERSKEQILSPINNNVSAPADAAAADTPADTAAVDAATTAELPAAPVATPAATPLYKRNLVVLWFGCFISGVGLSIVQPFMPLFIDTLGDFTREQLSFWSGMIMSGTFLTSALTAPFWGRLADRTGRKLMLLRSAVGMSVIMIATSFVTSVQMLLVLRLVYGVFSGYIGNAVALMAVQVPREESGKVLGTLSTSSVSGQLIGPLFGSTVVTIFGYSKSFLVTGSILVIVFLLTLFMVKEDFTPVPKGEQQKMREVFQTIEKPKVVVGVFITSTILMLTQSSINPIMSLYVREIVGTSSNVEMWSGLAFSAPALTAIIAAPILGALGDRIGTHKVLMFGLLLSSVVFIPMAYVGAVWQLIILRMLLGVTDASLRPSTQTLLTRNSPKESISRIFAYNQSCQSMGMVFGPIVGAAISGPYGYHSVFFATSVFAAVNLINVVRITRNTEF
ncbi:MAG: multidrug efflux MFS transporter [Coriobacteriia bacterium]|nr:multidrug efflux MFS transporter [Coriobacteriia bacterium]